MDNDIIIKRINAAIRFFLYMLIFWLPYSPAVIESSVIISCILWVVKRGYIFFSTHPRNSTLKNKLFQLVVSFKPCSSFLDRPVAFFIFACILSVIGSPFFEQTLKGLLTKTLEWFIIYYLIIETFTERKHVRIALSVFIFTAFSTCLDGLWQYYVTQKDIFLHREILPYARVTASFKTANDFGGFLTLIIPFVITRLYCPEKRKYAVTFWIGFLIVAIWALILTFSRGAWLGVLVGIILPILFTRKKILLGILMSSITIIMLFYIYAPIEMKNKFRMDLTNVEQTAQWRTQRWEDSLVMIKERPFFGHGLNMYMRVFQYYRKDDTYDPTYAHNCYLQMAAEVGLAGLLCFLWITIRLFGRTIHKIRENVVNDIYLRNVMIGLLGGSLAYLVHAATDTNFYSLQLSSLFWCMVGILSATYNLLET